MSANMGSIGTDTSPWSATINGSPVAVSSAGSGGGMDVSLTLASSPSNGDIVAVSYNPPPYTLPGLNGSQVQAFTISAPAT